ncbi:RluA family pseudouridine synthase [Trichloromonas sp.]|uniref:RluA family pseudouridine synthase n=1 Tax=Trichloromonas sp. TaxID=3069249 RepID=UPI002A49B8F7|nr:RluA family pseudouridine synthase [Trichloromonas sp.]
MTVPKNFFQRKIHRYLPSPKDEGLRLDQYLAFCSDELSRTLVRKLVDLGGVHVGGRRIRKCAHPVHAGEGVEVYVDGLPLDPFELRDGDILYRDRFLIAVNKPAGVDTQPTPARYRGTLYEALLRYLHDPYRPKDIPEIGMAQRLDRDTSGVLLFSIHRQAHSGLTQAIAERAAKKTYLALVAGTMPASCGEFRSLLARNRASNLVRSVSKGGKEAVTRYRVVREWEGVSLLEIDLLTGRSHQIRAHLSEAGHPLLGDQRYGGPTIFAGQKILRQMLHSLRLSLVHPVDRHEITVEAPLSADFQALVDHLNDGVNACSLNNPFLSRNA